MKTLMIRVLAALTIWLATALPASAFEPKPTDIGLQAPASPNMVRLHDFHDHILMIVITGIVVFVFLLLAWVVLRYNAKANPVPSKTTHHVLLEVLWTVVPIVILICIAVPSYKLLFYLDRTATPDMTLKLSGYQWGWTYSYPEQEGLEFNADIIRAEKHADGTPTSPEEDIAEINKYIPDGKGRRLLETYNPIVLPTEKNIQILTTASDVIHSWTIPAFGVKKDAVPGRTNETWVRINEPGVYYGQCSEICGIDHSAMPIVAYAVPEAEYKAWLACVSGTGAESKSDFPARACVQSLGFDKYRTAQKSHLAQTTTEETAKAGAQE
jgi:cytochrome c oxidase subunit 2